MNRDGPPVLLLHGLGGDRAQSLTLLAPEAHYTRIAPELPGHGETDLADDEPVTFAHFAALVADQLDELIDRGRIPEGPVPVAGVSMGAGIALALASARPDLVERLVLIRPAWLDTSPAPNLAAFGVIAGLLTEPDISLGEKTFASSALFRAIEGEAPAMARSLLGQFRRPHARERARVLAELPLSLPLPGLAAYRAISAAALVLVAPEDPVHPSALGAELARRLPDARLGTLPRKQPDATEHQSALQRAVGAYLAEAR